MENNTNMETLNQRKSGQTLRISNKDFRAKNITRGKESVFHSDGKGQFLKRTQ